MPQLALNTGVSAGYVSRVRDDHADVQLHGRAGDIVADLDYTSARTALTGGTITDQANGSAANPTLPAPAAAGSLGGNRTSSSIRRPAVIGVSAGVPTELTGSGVVPIQVTFTHPVVVVGSRNSP